MSVATIGTALVEKRVELGLEKGQAADKIGMSRTTYSSYEQDAQRPSVDVFPALAEFLDISMEELLTLYGATCVAAVRPTLEKVLSSNHGGVQDGRGSGQPSSGGKGLASTSISATEGDRVDETLKGHDQVAIDGGSVIPRRDTQDDEPVEPIASDISVAPATTPSISELRDQRSPDPEGSADRAAVPPVRPIAFEGPTSIFKRELSDGSEKISEHRKKKKKKKKKN
jgi:DNA-binding XRE family transcriptional regulator